MALPKKDLHIPGINLPYRSSQTSQRAVSKQFRHTLRITLIVFLGCLTTLHLHSRPPSPISHTVHCSTTNIHHNTSFLSPAHPISTAEFITRQDTLAQSLQSSLIDALIIEPGPTFQYYGNVSQADWEPWEPEERPFLMIVTPWFNWVTRRLQAKTVFLAPRFEEERVRGLGVPVVDGRVEVVVYEEWESPFEVLGESLVVMVSEMREETVSEMAVVVDGEMREFIVRGLRETGSFNIAPPTSAMELIRQIKSPAEIEILRAVNTGTVEAIRAVRPCLSPGLTENAVKYILDQTLVSVGFTPFFNLILFDDDAAEPHRASGEKKLAQDTLILIDVGAHYLGYASDVTRTIYPPRFKRSLLQLVVDKFRLIPWLSEFIPSTTHPAQVSRNRTATHTHAFNTVLAAQSSSLEELVPSNTISRIDIAARNTLSSGGFNQTTIMQHRVGHGIGIKAHEMPYLHLANADQTKEGMVVTLEPGVYVKGKYGVRIEDVFMIKGDGEADYLSGRRAVSLWDP